MPQWLPGLIRVRFGCVARSSLAGCGMRGSAPGSKTGASIVDCCKIAAELSVNYTSLTQVKLDEVADNKDVLRSHVEHQLTCSQLQTGAPLNDLPA